MFNVESDTAVNYVALSNVISVKQILYISDYDSVLYCFVPKCSNHTLKGQIFMRIKSQVDKI